jgi:type II secretory pathway component GspD/PulD (secretin)
MDFKDASLKDILKALSIQSGINFIASQEIEDRTVTLYLDQVPLKGAMDNLFKANDLDYEYYEESKIMLVKKGEPGVQTITKVFPLKYHSVPSSKMKQEVATSLECEGAEGGDIVASIEKVLSPDGTISEDTRTNSLIITDRPSRFPIIEQILARLDVPAPQVLLEVEVLDVSKGAVDKLGVNWPETLAKLDVTGSRATSFPFWSSNNFDDLGQVFVVEETAGGWQNVSWPTDHFGPSILTIIGSQLTLDFYKSQTDTKTLARPRILTLNNETAEIKITTDEVVGLRRTEEEEGGQGTVTYEAERYETGVTLRVTPQINLVAGEITMFIVPTVSDATRSPLSNVVGEFWNPEVRSTKSVVRVRDGETVVLGGLIHKEAAETRGKVPILGDIPIIGALFRSKSPSEESERELLVFITPHIVNDINVSLAKGSNMGFPSREYDISRQDRRLSTIEAALDSFIDDQY